MSWEPPTIAQQRGFAYAQKPLGAISFLSSCYVIYHITCQRPEKRKRLYHCLVLAMNIALLFLSFSHVWGTWAVPEGTPYYVGAAGTINTCIAQGFISNMFMMTVPIYYGSLVLQAYLGIKNNFQEDKYRWIEYPVHLVAYGFACALASVVVATDNMNPGGSGCSTGKSPRGCESDPDVPCERGKDIDFFIYIAGFSQIFVYLIFPPSVILSMYLWIKRTEKESSKRYQAGMSVVRGIFQRQMMQNIYRQISVYLFSFWFTWIPGMIHVAYKNLTGDPAYNLNIFSNCMFALQGFILMLVYFTLNKMGRPKAENIVQQQSSTAINSSRVPMRRHLTVADIRASVQMMAENDLGQESVSNSIKENFDFNIFDGTPDSDSPWAVFIDPDSDEEGSADGSNKVLSDVQDQNDKRNGHRNKEMRKSTTNTDTEIE